MSPDLEPTTTDSPPPKDSLSKTQSAIQSLSLILPSFPPSLTSSFCLLQDEDVSSQISSLLRHPDAGAGENHLCRWLYDNFQSSDHNLQLAVLRHLPTLAGVYLSRAGLRKPLAGFEAVLLALYSHETTSRGGQPVTVHVPDLSRSSLYHETSKGSNKNDSTGLNLTVISPSLEPQGTMRSTKRARIVGVALELYYSKIAFLPVGSKMDFCEFCVVWAGQDGNMYKEEEEDDEDDDKHSLEPVDHGSEGKKGRIPLPWELLQPVLRILGHCMMGPSKHKALYDAACVACRSLYARSLHDINPKAILATRSLLKLGKMKLDLHDDLEDFTELTMTNVITL